MPLVHERTFRVRHHECDANGFVHPASHLRYMQEAAFDASAAAGYDLARYEAMDRIWLVRSTDIEYLDRLAYGDSVTVKTYVADFRRIRSRRAYELYREGPGDPIASASTDWVFLESVPGDAYPSRPAEIPEEMKAAFMPEGPPVGPGSPPPQPRFPAAPAPQSGMYQARRRVAWGDLDQAKHVNNAVYLAYLEDLAVQMAVSSGWPPARLEAMGFTVLPYRHTLEYLQPAVLDDQLELSCWVSHAKDRTAVRHSTITRSIDGALVVRARTLWGCADLDTGQLLQMDEGFLADLQRDVHRAGVPLRGPAIGAEDSA